ncbi:hypothetical protein DIS18_05305 [Algibacter marinivivus]|uniref:Uncharacterized protein n=1 Tax=Algibacter marinivivus TaxID=2100723 RepID=A0A2U2X834_9FLAO|nr:hypothetical protein DIS18_05305 [Algibacter marinivivus]
MENNLTILIALALFLIITFLYWKLTKKYAEKLYGKEMWKQWSSRTFYWTSAVMMSGGITLLVILLIK